MIQCLTLKFASVESAYYKTGVKFQKNEEIVASNRVKIDLNVCECICTLQESVLFVLSKCFGVLVLLTKISHEKFKI